MCSAHFFAAFNWAFDRVIDAYGRGVALFLRISVIALAVYGGLMGLTYLGFQAVPAGFIPDQDKGYLVVNAQLPDGASLDRTDKIVQQMSDDRPRRRRRSRGSGTRSTFPATPRCWAPTSATWEACS